MIVVIDTNILFSALISPNGKIGDLLLSPISRYQWVSGYYTLAELFKHQPKIVQLAKQPADQVMLLLYALLQKIELLNENFIEPSIWQKADELTKGVDSFDIRHVALTLKTGGYLWTGDKRLATHLQSMGFDRVVTTQALYDPMG